MSFNPPQLAKHQRIKSIPSKITPNHDIDTFRFKRRTQTLRIMLLILSSEHHHLSRIKLDLNTRLIKSNNLHSIKNYPSFVSLNPFKSSSHVLRREIWF